MLRQVDGITKPVESWFLKLCDEDPESATLVERAIDRLAEVGPALGRPLVDTLVDRDMSNLKELRPGAKGRSEIRIVFVFDPDRQAVFLVAGDKGGRWSRWYEDAIPLAKSRYADYVAELKGEGER